MMNAPIKPVLEALIFASESPLSRKELRRILLEGESPEWTEEDLEFALTELLNEANRDECGFGLMEVAGGYHFRSKATFAPYLRRLQREKPQRLSRSAMETLSIVAYRQPLTRAEIEEVRGVDSSATLKTLLERSLLRLVGYSDDPGKPALYGTTPLFLETFHLKSLSDLPALEEPEAIAEELRLPLEAAETAEEENQTPANSETTDALPPAERELVRLAEESQADQALIESLEAEMEKLTGVHTRIAEGVFAPETPTLIPPPLTATIPIETSPSIPLES